MGPEDRPFSERMWGMGRRVVPTARGRQGCMVLLLVGFALIVVVVVIALFTGPT